MTNDRGDDYDETGDDEDDYPPYGNPDKRENWPLGWTEADAEEWKRNHPGWNKR